MPNLLINLFRWKKCLDISVAKTKSNTPCLTILKVSLSMFLKMLTLSSARVSLKPEIHFFSLAIVKLIFYTHSIYQMRHGDFPKLLYHYKVVPNRSQSYIKMHWNSKQWFASIVMISKPRYNFCKYFNLLFSGWSISWIAAESKQMVASSSSM